MPAPTSPAKLFSGRPADLIATARRTCELARHYCDESKTGGEQAKRSRESARKLRETSRRLCSLARAQRSATAHELMPLDLAATAVYRRVYDDYACSFHPIRPTAHLDAMAYTIAEYAKVYTYRPDGNTLRVLLKEDLSGGLFSGGGRTITYLDDRSTLKNLAVSVRSLEAVILALRDARGLGDARRVRRG